eukprot:6213193-Pleurochrysis_carterae.AAC.5
MRASTTTSASASITSCGASCGAGCGAGSVCRPAARRFPLDLLEQLRLAPLEAWVLPTADADLAEAVGVERADPRRVLQHKDARTRVRRTRRASNVHYE